MIVYVERDNNGNIIGVYANPQPGYAEEALPSNDPQVQAFLNPPPTALEVAAQKKAKGIAITSTSNSQLNATYALDVNSLMKMNSINTYINTNNRLPGGAVTMQYPDINGALRPFTTTAQFLGFATASGDLVTKIDLGQSPPQSATIP